MEAVMVRNSSGKIKRIVADPLTKWLSCYQENQQNEKQRKLDHFLAYVNRQPGWEGTDYQKLIIRHLESEYEEEVLDLLEDYIKAHQSIWRYNSLQNEYSTIRTFFDKNRASLPKDPDFKIRSLIPPTEGHLELKHIPLLALAARPVYRSAFLFKWMSMLDTKRLILMNEPPYSDEIVQKLRDRKDGEIIQVDVKSGRKKLANKPEGKYRFGIGKDAIDSLIDYFENHRQGGWPQKGEAMWLYPEHRSEDSTDWHEQSYKGAGRPITQFGLNQTWRRLLNHTGLIKNITGGRKGTVRYGFNLHEMRDVAATTLHLKAARHGLDMDCVKYWCGQNGQLDPNKYDKFMKDVAYTAEQYKIAEVYLNVVSNPNPDAVRDAEKRSDRKNEALMERISKLEADYAEQAKLLREYIAEEVADQKERNYEKYGDDALDDDDSLREGRS